MIVLKVFLGLSLIVVSSLTVILQVLYQTLFK